MKTLRFLLWAFLLVAGFTACSNDIDGDEANGGNISIEDINPKDPESIQKALVGKWKLVEWPGIDLNYIKAHIIEFTTDYSLVFHTREEFVQDWGKTRVSPYTIIDGWTKDKDKLDGYTLVKASETENTLYHLYITKDKMTLEICYDEPLESMFSENRNIAKFIRMK